MAETSVTFEVATLADALGRAKRIAPLLNANTGNTAGILLEIRPDDEEEPVLVRATDGDIFWDNWLMPVEVTGPEATWRFPANHFADLVGSLPIGMDKTITLTAKDRATMCGLQASKVKAGIPLMRGDTYPIWEPFDDEYTFEVEDLGEKLAMISWAAVSDQKVTPWSGVKFTGKHIIATDTRRFAAVPCEIPLDAPVTLPVGRFAQLVKNVGSVRVGVHRGQFLVVPDEYSQLRSTTYSKGIPPTERIMRDDYEYSVVLPKDEVADAVRRIGQVADRVKAPGIYVSLGEGQVEFAVDGGAEGWAREEIDAPEADHPVISIKVLTALFTDAIVRGQGEKFTMQYDDEAQKAKPRLHFTSSKGYQVWMPEQTGVTQ